MVTKKMLGTTAIAFALLIAGCSNGGSKEVSPEKTITPIKQDPVELVFYYPFGDWNDETFTETFAAPIQKKYPHITIKFLRAGKGTEIQELITAGTKIDVIFTSLGATAEKVFDFNLQYDIDPLIKKNNFDLKKLDPAMVESLRQLSDGKMYGLPIYAPPSTIYYNKDIFDKFGVAYPKDGMTWDDLYDMSKKLTRNHEGVQYYGFASSHAHTYMMNQRSIPLVDTKTKTSTFYTDANWKPYLQNFIRMYQIPGYENMKSMSEGGERGLFFKGRTVAMFSAITALQNPKDLEGLNWDWVTYPVFNDKPDTGPQAYPMYFYITNMSDHKDAAFQSIAHLASDEFQMESSKKGLFVPASSNPDVLKAFGQDSQIYKGKNVAAVRPKKYAVPGSLSRYFNGVAWNLDGAVQEVIRGKKDLNEALRTAAEGADKMIQDKENAKK